MNPASFEFAAFFGFTLLARGLFRSHRSERWFLLIASLVFSLVSSAIGSMVISVITLVDFTIGRALERTTDAVRRKRLLVLSLTTSLGLLGFFKYTGFALENLRYLLASLGIEGVPLEFRVSAPPGISFFTFASISYVVDVYNKRLKATDSLRDYAYFLTFFPKLLAGPITRATAFLPQLKARPTAQARDIETAFAYILSGAVKKLVIADQVVGHVDLIFASPGQFDSLTLLQGAMGYAVQIYCDFSGYSDMAVGVARLLGIRLPENFQMPFSAPTITDYWRRWHITMSNWFRDYLFFPLEMSRKRSLHPTLRTATSLCITWLVCGLWHGAAWNYVVWGGIHGLSMAGHVAWRAWNPLRLMRRFRLFNITWAALSHSLTLAIVLLSSVVLQGIFSLCSESVPRSDDATRLWRGANAVTVHPAGGGSGDCHAPCERQGQQLAGGNRDETSSDPAAGLRLSPLPARDPRSDKHGTVRLFPVLIGR